MSAPTPEDIQYYQEHASDSLQPNLIATIITCTIFPIIAVVLRVVCRRMTRTPLLTDDWLIIFALIPMVGMHASTAFAIHYGMGKHVIFVTNLEAFVKSIITIEFFYAICVIATKFSILALYHRIFPSKSVLFMSIFVAVIVFLYNVALIMVVFFQCVPLKKIWTPTIEGNCFPTSVAFTTLAIVNVVTDAAILTLPIKQVWGLQMEWSRKLQVLGIFLLGGIICVFGVIRVTVVGIADISDPSYTNAKGGIWSQAEISVGVVCACLPIYRPLFAKSARRNQGSTGYSSKRNNGGVGSKLSALSSNTGRFPFDRIDDVPLKSVGEPRTVWSTASGRKSQSGDSDQRPFVILDGQDESGIRVHSQIDQTWKEPTNTSR